MTPLSEVRHKVAIAGTVTDQLTGKPLEAVPVVITGGSSTDFVDRLITWARSAALYGAPNDVRKAREFLDAGDFSDEDTLHVAELDAARKVLDFMRTRGRVDYRVDRPDMTTTAVDGHYYFMDLPNGQYQVTATPTNTRHGSSVGIFQVPHVQDDESDKLNYTLANLELSPTAIIGMIRTKPDPLTPSEPSKPVKFASVRIAGTSLDTLSNTKGEYQLLPLTAMRDRPWQITVHVSARGFKPSTQDVEISGAGNVVWLDFELESA